MSPIMSQTAFFHLQSMNEKFTIRQTGQDDTSCFSSSTQWTKNSLARGSIHKRVWTIKIWVKNYERMEEFQKNGKLFNETWSCQSQLSIPVVNLRLILQFMAMIIYLGWLKNGDKTALITHINFDTLRICRVFTIWQQDSDVDADCHGRN